MFANPKAAMLAVVGAVVLALAVGAKLRLEDPLSSPVLPAEDAFSNTALVREHLRDGELSSLNEGGTLYPPGMHGYVAAFWIYTGADVYQLARFLPTLFGLIGILGIALLVGRWDGRLAAFAGALAMAVQPEAIFRTTMFAPTAIDLAVLPFLLYALLELLHGRIEWAGLAAPLALFLTFAHPWLLAILGLAGAIYTILALALPPTNASVPRLTAAGLALGLAIVGLGAGLALSGCWGGCGPGFRDVYPGGARLAVFAPFVIAAAAAPAGILFALRRGKAVTRTSSPPRRPFSLLTRLLLSVFLAALLTAITVPALAQGMPPYVDLPRMIGWPVLILAALGLIALPFLASPAANVGAALALVCYPLVIFNPLQSEFWSHRTVAFLTIGLAILVGVAVAGAWRATAAAFSAQRLARVDTLKIAGRPLFAAVPALLVIASLGGVVAATPGVYADGWYRLYEPCPFHALEDVADRAAAEPSAVVITGNWRPKLALAAITPNASRIWYDEEFFASRAKQDQLVDHFLLEDRALIVVLDEYIRNETSATETDFSHDPWKPLGRWCDETPATHVEAYIAGGEGP